MPEEETTPVGDGEERPQKMRLDVYVDKRLRELVIAIVNQQNITVSEYVANLIAKALKRPDLAGIPRKRLGRPLGSKAKPKAEAPDDSL